MENKTSPAIITDVTMQNASAFFGDLATTNYFQVYINGFNSDFRDKLRTADWGPKLKWETFGEALGLLCTDASIPASTYATAEVKDNYMGVPQEFAHTRLYTDIDFSFYIDSQYNVLQFFEFWMNYIGAGNQKYIGEPAASSDPIPNNYRRFTYPEEYKTSHFYITKFERNYNTTGTARLQYRLINAFPKSVNAIPVSYGPAELMKVSVTMTYDRYIVSRETLKKAVTQEPKPKPPVHQTGGGSTLVMKTRDLNPTERRQGIDRRGTDIRGGNFRTP